MAKLPPYFNIQFFDNNGDPLSGGKVYTYDNGTTTNKTTYQDADESAANTNPIILDSAGRANIYLDEGSYTFKVDTSADVELYTVDDITGETANAFGSSVQDISSNTAITTAQQNSILVCTSSPTLSLLSSATAGQGFVFTVKNNGTGTVTIDPNASETIDGSATKTVAAGYTVLVVCDGTNWRTAFEGPTEFTGVLAINGTASAAAGISLAEDTDNGTNTVTLRAAASIASDFTLTLPSADGTSGQAITTDGNGSLSFADVDIAQDHIAGLVLSNDTDTDHDINITAGQAADSSNASYLTLASEITKQIDATWAAGNDAGGLFTGTVANNTTYHVFIIEKDSDGSIDAGFDTSVTAANIPTGYTKYRRIGSVYTDGSANIVQFTQDGERFLLDTPVTDVNTTPSATAVLRTLSVPSGIKVRPISYAAISSAGLGAAPILGLATSPDQSDTAPSATLFNYVGRGDGANAIGIGIGYLGDLATNTSAQLRFRATAATGTEIVTTHGWIDKR